MSGTTSATTSTSTDSTESGSSSEESTDESTDESADEFTDGNTDTWGIPEDYPTIPECDHFSQDCPDGDKCVPYAKGGTEFDDVKCVPITGEGEPGDPCTYGGIVESTDDCGATSFCWTDGADTGTCTLFCGGWEQEPVCPMGLECQILIEDVFALCTPP